MGKRLMAKEEYDCFTWSLHEKLNKCLLWNLETAIGWRSKKWPDSALIKWFTNSYLLFKSSEQTSIHLINDNNKRYKNKPNNNNQGIIEPFCIDSNRMIIWLIVNYMLAYSLANDVCNTIIHLNTHLYSVVHSNLDTTNLNIVNFAI